MRSLLLAACLLTAARCRGVQEFDASTLWTAVEKDQERDLVVFFATAASSAPLRAHVDTLARKLKLDAPASAFSLGLFDVHLHGWPKGLHVHGAGEGAVILFPAGGREPVRYDFQHDPLSYPLGGDGAAPPEEEVEEVDEDGHAVHKHSHAPAPTVAGTLRWLRRHSSYPSEVPEVGLSEIWEGREDGLFTAVLKGLEALHKRMEALQKENAQLRAELLACKR
jgi:hypothetical protein